VQEVVQSIIREYGLASNSSEKEFYKVKSKTAEVEF
jgi:hypothetical protein